jgi:hypothetical protein
MGWFTGIEKDTLVRVELLDQRIIEGRFIELHDGLVLCAQESVAMKFPEQNIVLLTILNYATVISTDILVLLEQVKQEYYQLLREYRYSDILSAVECYTDRLEENETFGEFLKKAKELHANYRKFRSSLPAPETRYAQAKWVQYVEKNLTRAASLFEQSINMEEETKFSAIKDYIQMYQSTDVERSIELAELYKSYFQLHKYNYAHKAKFYRSAVEYVKFNNFRINIYLSGHDDIGALRIINETLTTIKSNQYLAKEVFKDQFKELYFRQGQTYLRMNTYQKAIEGFEEAKRHGSNEIMCDRYIALCYVGQNNLETAREWFQRLFSLGDVKSEEYLKQLDNADPDIVASASDEIQEEITHERLDGNGGFSPSSGL